MLDYAGRMMVLMMVERVRDVGTHIWLLHFALGAVYIREHSTWWARVIRSGTVNEGHGFGCMVGAPFNECIQMGRAARCLQQYTVQQFWEG